MKKLIAFDLDGTLAESKMKLSDRMADILCQLLAKTKVAVISGAGRKQFENQFLSRISCSNLFHNLTILPLNGTQMCHFEKNDWVCTTNEGLNTEEKTRILDAFSKILPKIGLNEPIENYIEDRGGQITFSGLGPDASLEEKKSWDLEGKKRLEIKQALLANLNDFEVSLGGITSIDITKKGIDKAFGVKQLLTFLSLSEDEVVYFGDAFNENGNDYPVKKMGVTTHAVSGPEETESLIREFLQDDRN